MPHPAITAPRRIDAEEFRDKLEVMPPSKWTRSRACERFHLCEYKTDNLVYWYIRIGDAYWAYVGEDKDSLDHSLDAILKAEGINVAVAGAE